MKSCRLNNKIMNRSAAAKNNAMHLSAMFDIADSLPTTDKIRLYVDMMSYEFLKPFADESLDDLKRDLLMRKDHNNLELLKHLLYNIGIDFKYHLAEKTVYDNKHNVHILSKSTIEVAHKIIKSYPTSSFYIPSELKEYDDFFKLLVNSEPYNNTLDSKSLFMSIWNCICNSKHRDDLLNRLKQELDDAKGHCLTGCIVRLVNAIRGFNFLEFETELDDYEYERSKTFNLLTKHLNQYNITSSEDIINEIERIVNKNIIVLSQSYGKRILDAYTGTKSWYIVNGKYVNT
jgi:hypothetical protein